ncbi:MAG: STAS/SEC14 domain-containing protein [Pseudonocardiaceae bacterium]
MAKTSAATHPRFPHRDDRSVGLLAARIDEHERVTRVAAGRHLTYDEAGLSQEPLIPRSPMITINPEAQRITVTVFAEFTLADYREFEAAALSALQTQRKPNLLFDLSEMTGYTLDLAWEEVRFTRRHVHDFPKIAVVTTDQWLIWSAWLSQLFVEADLQVFDDADAALAWLAEGVA